MNKLRAMEYFVRVAETGSFAAAARQLDVSPPAVTKLIAALERELGVLLLRRDSRHVSLTPDGEQYFPVCASALAEVRAAEANLSVNRTRASGKLTVGMAKIVGQDCVAPVLSKFLARHPGLTLDLRVVNNPTEPLAALVDVVVFAGWLDDTDMVAKCIAQTRRVTCASPAYWENHGRPIDPDELRGHDCLAFRSPWGVVLDLWKYQRGEEVRTVALEPRIVSDDRDWTIAAAVRGMGIVNVADLTARSYFEQGLLEPVLEDWECLEAPPIHVLYRRGLRRSARVRAFVEFVTELFGDLEMSRPGVRQTKLPAVPMPPWHHSKWVGPLTRRARGPSGSAVRVVSRRS